MKTAELKNQIEVERLAREANKMRGITYALDSVIYDIENADMEKYEGVFEAAEDIATALWSDLKALADKINAEKWQ